MVKDKETFSFPETPRPSGERRIKTFQSALEAFDTHFQSSRIMESEEIKEDDDNNIIPMKKNDLSSQGFDEEARLKGRREPEKVSELPLRKDIGMKKYRNIAASLVAIAAFGVFSMRFFGSQQSHTFYYVGSEMAGARNMDNSRQYASRPQAPRTLPIQSKRIGRLVPSHNRHSTSAVAETENLTAEPTPVVETYAHQDDFKKFETNPFKSVQAEPVSTFSLDVDTASYSFMRASLNQNRLPRADSVRVEEFINYFPYDYPAPQNAKEPFKTTISVMPSPWVEGRKIMHIGVKGYEVKTDERPKANLVFLIDTSGSMYSENRLPLAQKALNMLVDQLAPEDTISIVTYSGSSQIALKPTPAQNKRKIKSAINNLRAGGGTAGAQGLKTAYELAEENFDKNGVNRIILTSDGDFNIGMTNQEEMKTFISRKRDEGIFLSVLGFGMGNYKDSMMQILAQNGNGVAAYIDTLSEARKVLVQEATSSIIPIAKDVKIQVEFNPNTVQEYRLVGYEKRLLRQEDFNNDKVDAGDIGSGHTVTAIYEFIPSGELATVDSLRYKKRFSTENETLKSSSKDTQENEYAVVKMRYKLPKSDVSILREEVVNKDNDFTSLTNAPQEARFAFAVASFAEFLRGGTYSGSMKLDDIIKLAQGAKGTDPFGYRSEFIQLVRAAQSAH